METSSLEELGWDAHFAAGLGDTGLTPARVIMTRGPVSRLHDGSGEHDAMLSGKLRHGAAGAVELPVVGDWVGARLSARAGELASVETVLPRRTLFVRRAPGEGNIAQALAANVDVVFLVMGLDGDFKLRRLERYLAVAWSSGATPVVILSKADLCPEAEARRLATEAVAPGVTVVTAVLTEEDLPAPVRAHVQTGKTVALLGSSGVGKSTLLNRLLARDAQKTGAVRRHDARGRHTTSHRQLFFVPGGGLVIDSPGLREIQLWAADDGLSAAFDDVAALADGCRFRDCTHGDEPGCAVRDALPADRLESWHKLRGELAATAATEDVLARSRQKQHQRAGARSLRKRVREKQK